ncbi:hypothetical protein ACIO3O_12905 [Streptomyces sp. NPDC087440]|uniref:hypothetical protein n=1 Tax=Streptomyces sp. NPDC087440 TaxID=3365790 RepID=UPI0037F8E6CD
MSLSRTALPLRPLARVAAALPLLVAPLLLAAPSAHAAPMPLPTPALDADPCFNVETPPGYVCVPAPKECFAAPCPQYEVVPATEA